MTTPRPPSATFCCIVAMQSAARNDIIDLMKNMIGAFRAKGLRSLQDVELKDLGRVNAFVGRNGAGKTTLLEAFYLFFTRATLESIIGIAERRGEYDKTDGSGLWAPSVRHFFAGHALMTGRDLTLLSGDDAIVSFSIGEEAMPLKDDYRIVKPTTMCHISCGNDDMGWSGLSFPLCKSGAIDSDYTGDGGYKRILTPDDVPVAFVDPDGMSANALLKMRDEVVSRGVEGELVKALKLLDPRVESVGFLSAGEKAYKFLANGTMVGLSGLSGRVPVKTLGDGMRRLLVIAMAIVCVRGGALILDEVDSGLHYSAMESLWDFIYKAAEANDVQVFASTHSLDCLRGLAVLCETSQTACEAVRLYSLSNTGKRVVLYSGRDMSIAVNSEIEVRA